MDSSLKPHLQLRRSSRRHAPESHHVFNSRLDRCTLLLLSWQLFFLSKFSSLCPPPPHTVDSATPPRCQLAPSFWLISPLFCCFLFPSAFPCLEPQQRRHIFPVCRLSPGALASLIQAKGSLLGGLSLKLQAPFFYETLLLINTFMNVWHGGIVSVPVNWHTRRSTDGENELGQVRQKVGSCNMSAEDLTRSDGRDGAARIG